MLSREGNGMPTDVSAEFIEKSRSLIEREYLPKIEQCLSMLSDDDVWARPNEASNSIGNLLLHLRGNVTQWIVAGVGRNSRARNRQQEFDERRRIPSQELLEGLRAAVKEASDIIGSLDANDLMTRREIQNYDVTVLEAVYHVIEHFSMHTGQIILITKARTGTDLKLWRPSQKAAV
jgi:uncharacterized damage-inducible protein DinB